ncbi:hypothetical protein LCGC14_2806320, partial [marine sediment metagenome]
VADFDSSPTNQELQKGHPLTVEEFNEKIKKVNHQLRVERQPLNKTKGMFYWIRNDLVKGGTVKQQICPCEGNRMPEYSIMSTQIEELPNMKPILGKDDEAIIRTEVLYDELERGWRTLLIRAIIAGAATLEKVEQVFGSSPRARWQTQVGKGSTVLAY